MRTLQILPERLFPAIGAIVSITVMATLQSVAQEASATPNVLLILADDMGCGDVRALNPDSSIPTPHLNLLAETGVTFTDAHSPSAVCTPTRYALLTGRYSWRSRLKRGVLDGYDGALLEPGRVTLGTLMRDHGYHTGIVGKWHLGLGFARTSRTEIDFSRPVDDGPHTHGFDYSFIIPASLDFPPYVYIRNGQVTRFPVVRQPAQSFPAFLREGPRSPDLVMEDVLDDLTAEAVGYMETRVARGEPFFLYFPLTAPHKPTLPHPRFRGETDLGPYGDFIHQVDATMGEVLGALTRLGIEDNTLVIFTSDNGSYMYRQTDSDAKDHVNDPTIQAYRPEHHTANSIYRGTKADIWEGGHRVPFFVRWPARFEGGRRVDTPITHTDIFATLAAILGSEPAAGAALDSFSLVDFLDGRPGATRGEPVIHHSAQGVFAIRDGDWKLVLGNGSGGREQPRGEPFQHPYQLFDLSTDPRETDNVIDGHAEVAAQLERAFMTIYEAAR